MQPSSGGDMTPSQVASQYKDQIAAASQATGVPPGILAGQIWQESKGIANTPGGGLMQLGPNEFQQYGGGDMSNPADNIMAGAKYMKSLSSQFGGNMEAALRAYNSGPNGVDLNNLNSTPAGTGDPTYVTKVMQAAQQSGLAT
ncbi:lytic transglycosylase domain-containing protein [Trinickia terrae]|nr:lytic transglycosylase domain-containing protein [Trinickia terrae]